MHMCAPSLPPPPQSGWHIPYQGRNTFPAASAPGLSRHRIFHTTLVMNRMAKYTMPMVDAVFRTCGGLKKDEVYPNRPKKRYGQPSPDGRYCTASTRSYDGGQERRSPEHHFACRAQRNQPRNRFPQCPRIRGFGAPFVVSRCAKLPPSLENHHEPRSVQVRRHQSLASTLRPLKILRAHPLSHTDLCSWDAGGWNRGRTSRGYPALRSPSPTTSAWGKEETAETIQRQPEEGQRLAGSGQAGGVGAEMLLVGRTCKSPMTATAHPAYLHTKSSSIRHTSAAAILLIHRKACREQHTRALSGAQRRCPTELRQDGR